MTFEQWMETNFPEFSVASLTSEQSSRFRKLYDADEESLPDADTDLEADDALEGADDGMCDDGEEDETAPDGRSKKKVAANRQPANRKKLTASNGNPPRRRPVGNDGATADDAFLEMQRRETLRIEKVNRLCAGRSKSEKIQAIYETAIENGTDVRDVELAVMRASRSAPSTASPEVVGDEAIESEIIQAALLLNTGGPRMKATRLKELGFSERAGNEATSLKWRGASLRRVCEYLNRKAGNHVAPMSGEIAHMRAVRATNTKLEAAGFTQLQLNYILENVQNKVLLDAYHSVNVLWPVFCTPTNNPDFKIYGRYALDAQSVFQQIGRQGQLAELQYGDRKYTTELETYGGRFSVDRQTWINDDLGAINSRISNVGILGAKTLDLNAHLMLQNGIGNTSMYHTNNNNYLANNANYALSNLGLQNARETFVNQVGFDNQPLGVALDTLMTGSFLQPVANQLYTSTYLNQEINTNATADQKGQDNPWKGQYKPVESTFLNNPAILDAYGNAIPHQDNGLWMLFGKQGNNAPFYVAFLNGQEAPTVLTEANTTSILGFELVVFLDFGFGYGDPRLSVCMNPNNA